MARSLNRVQLIGNLTRDPELRYTPTGAAVCTFSLATNRSWTTDSGEKKEESDFHRIVSWNKLAELCSQFLTKGRKVYVEGRLSNRTWQAQDGTQKNTTEVVIDDMILLDSPRRDTTHTEQTEHHTEEQASPATEETKPAVSKKAEEPKEESSSTEDVTPDDIPF